MDNLIRIAVCEDDPDDAEKLTNIIGQTGIPAETETFDSAEALLRDFRAERYDVIFFDIYMSGETGVNAAKTIRETDKIVTMAFTTTSLDHTLESYRVGAIKYLVKPVEAKDVKETLELALMKKKNRPAISLRKAGGGFESVPLDIVLYFEGRKDIVEAHTTSGVIKTSQSEHIDELADRLPSPPFIRAHHSFIVNLDNALKIDKEQRAFVMRDGSLAYIRRSMLGKCEEALKLRVMDMVGRKYL